MTALSPSELERYSRQIVLPEFGWEGQEALRRASVLLVGAGGLGSPAALYLAAAGVGTIGLVDYDRVDVSNLHRQVLYGTSNVGMEKVEAAAVRLRDLNPDVMIEKHALQLSSKNALDILKRYDVVVDGTDNFATRYLVNDACVLLGKPNVYGSVFRFEGQASLFSTRGGPCYRCLYPEPPPPSLIPSCAEGGVLGVLPGLIGTIQATETIKLLTGIGETLRGRLLIVDATSMQFRTLRLKKNEECSVCGTDPTVRELIDYDQFCGGVSVVTLEESEVITPVELRERLMRGEKLTVIDVREPHEWDRGRIAGAQHIPLGNLASEASRLDPEAEIVLYCRSGARSGRAVEMLKNAGFKKLKNLVGGVLRWAREVDPSVSAE